MVESVVYDMATDATTSETRFFISSLPVDPKRALEAIRAHWGVEAMHGTLDLDFDEDRSRARTEDIAENLAMLRHVVINVLRLDKSLFGGISVKAKGTHMGRRQAAEAHAGGVNETSRAKATNSSPRGLDARALTKEPGALDFSAWNSS